MSATIRRACARAEAILFGLTVLVTFLGVQVSFGQTAKYQTPEQTNKKIRELAALAQVHPMDTPIGVGDLLHIDVFEVPDLTSDVRVSGTGDISFPLIPGRIPVAGLTTYELQAKLAQLLIENGLVSHPQVSVFVKEQYSEPVNVVGAVGHPTVYQVMRPTTLLEVLAAAGGISPDAGGDVIITRPVVNDTPSEKPASITTNPEPDVKKITIRLQDLLETGNPVYNIPVYGGDTVTVPHAGVVYIMGQGIASPGEYVLEGHGESVTILRAVALAHGLTGFAKANSSVIMRNDPATGNRVVVHVRLKDIEKHKAEDIPLKSNDILYIPDSAGKKALARGAESALGIGTSLAVYRVP
ncbi:MAG TPA: polysaccharide biosynthesis/export family protein [Candidatus Dormibacteraeota bacterium]|nr:polysaccharide biosynthesis/export family protein [Candidatus Dormibacteraeota bacterium]